ncbi:MAG: PPOX class F420-dependent oxidoreductase [Pseudonocardiaceae bacterium]
MDRTDHYTERPPENLHQPRPRLRQFWGGTAVHWGCHLSHRRGGDPRRLHPVPAKLSRHHTRRPHVAPVWFDLDGDDLVFTTGERSVKGRNLIADPRLSICVDDERPPFEFVIIEGTAELSRDSGALREWAGRIGARYLGIDETDRLAELNGGPGSLLVRVIPTHIVSENSITE